MKVHELINMLEDLDQDKEILIDTGGSEEYPDHVEEAEDEVGVYYILTAT